IGELNGVGGNHARTMYPFAPVSIVLRLTTRRAPEFDIYGFRPKQDNKPDESQQELIQMLKEGLLPPTDFYLGGRIVREHPALRSFQSIEMSMTADFVTHSAAYGLLLGLAGVPRESKKDYAGARIALGLKGERLPLHGRAYQQLHWVKLEGRVEKRKGKPPKGETLKAAFERSKGTKPDIRPYIREFLHGCESYDEVDHDPTGKVSGARYRLHGFEGYIGLNDSALEE